ncbi:MAG: STAS domain-containing protein [Sphingobacteriales bacterium]|nr:MAG: STAS domain-containing protein [Sphingobacteriales bacterium]
MRIVKNPIAEGMLKLSIAGDLDAGSSMEVDRAFSEALQNRQFNILIDCKLLEYISSAGLGVFISHKDDFEDNKGSFIFFDMNEKVYNVFELLGLHNIFKIVSNEQDAKKLLSYEKN